MARGPCFSIGEFSKITGLSVKTVRFYHEKGLIEPVRIDAGSGYRYYDARCVDKARVVIALRGLGFGLPEISEVLKHHDDDSDILDFLERQQARLEERVEQYGEMASQIGAIVSRERAAKETMMQSTFEVEEKQVDEMLVAGIRMKGKYSDCSGAFQRLGRSFGRLINGKALLLHYDTEYKEKDADFEACMPVRSEKQVDGVSVRTLPGGRCVSLLHRGPYEELGRSYEKILAYMRSRDIEAKAPCREVYLKGPGMIFRGNPRKYLTEIQFMV